jgi:uncharacterized protein YxjI
VGGRASPADTASLSLHLDLASDGTLRGHLPELDLSGWGKALWSIFIIVLPFLGSVVCLIARGSQMQGRALRQAANQEAEFRAYVRDVGVSAAGSPADELAKFVDLRDRGVITKAEISSRQRRKRSHEPVGPFQTQRDGPRHVGCKTEREGQMPRLRGRGEEHEGTRRFQMHEKMFSIGDDYWIEDDSGQRAYRVNGKAIRLRDTWVLEDAAGNEVATIREKKLSIRNSITIDLGGRQATVKKALVGIRDRFNVEVDGGEDLKITGNIVDHEYEIERDGDKIAEVSKKWFRVRDTYGVEVRNPLDVPLVLAATVAIDGMTHDVG